MAPDHPTRAAIRAKEAASYLGIGVSSLWRKAKIDPTFPKPIKLGERTTVWRLSDLDTWLNEQPGA